MPRYYFEEDFLRDHASSGLSPVAGVALFIDFDGTLVTIQRDPSQCYLPARLKAQLSTLAGLPNVRVTVLSGRTLADIRKRVGVQGICYGGVHGIDISGFGIRYTHVDAKAVRPLIVRAKRRMEGELRAFEGAWMEDKKYTLSLHFRSARREDISAIKGVFYRTVAGLPGKPSLTVMKGKKVLELAPVKSWNKGKAALMILGLLGKDWLPVAIGDDVTDETAFEVLRDRGVTIRVGRSPGTSAQYYVRRQGEVGRLIDYIICGARRL
jgi:trehalose 6-phosphate phosphatase